MLPYLILLTLFVRAPVTSVDESDQEGHHRQCKAWAQAALTHQGLAAEEPAKRRRWWPALSVSGWSEVPSRHHVRVEHPNHEPKHAQRAGREGVEWGVYLSAKWTFSIDGVRPPAVFSAPDMASPRGRSLPSEDDSTWAHGTLEDRADWDGWSFERRQFKTKQSHSPPPTLPPRPSATALQVYGRVMSLCAEYIHRRQVLPTGRKAGPRSKDHFALERVVALLEAYVGKSIALHPSLGGYP